MLERELQKLLAVATDIDKKEEIKNTSTCKLWITRRLNLNFMAVDYVSNIIELIINYKFNIIKLVFINFEALPFHPMGIIPAFLTAVISVTSLAYNVGKDTGAHIRRKVSYSRNLKRNYKNLHWHATYVRRLSTDIGRVIHRRGLKSLKIYRRWSRSVSEAVGEAKTLCIKYKRTKKSWVLPRANLSKKMAGSAAKVGELAQNGKELAKLLQSNHGHKKRQHTNHSDTKKRQYTSHSDRKRQPTSHNHDKKHQPSNHRDRKQQPSSHSDKKRQPTSHNHDKKHQPSNHRDRKQQPLSHSDKKRQRTNHK
ncbi:hypothetical protein GH714_024686 [Hevea brasiliensis]|uniref:Uncharacterized protein n=2 Tax=Hevea brasiliensis TaxID=3981 RepID=A0A6A6N5L7_HEVBR|nr:hypothetical protein GH714_024686 [Hevea brasiliensis]